MRNRLTASSLLVSVIVIAAVGCADDGTPNRPEAQKTSGGSAGKTSSTAGSTSRGGGGVSAVGGSTARGGVTSAAGQTQTTSTAGQSSSTAGSTSTGGQGSSIAGATSVGGHVSSTAGSASIGGASVGGASGSAGALGTTAGTASVASGGVAATGGAANPGGATSVAGGAGGSATAGSAATAIAGATSAGGTNGTGGVAATGGATATCGALGQACCTNPANSCNTDLTCLLGASCSCAKGIFGSYIIRTDGVVLQMPTTATGAQTPVLDANTAQPITGVVSGFDGASVGDMSVGCAVKDDGTVWCWRSDATGNQRGNLGNGTTDTNGATFRATQVLIAANTPLTNVKTIDLTSTCAVTKDGLLYCWGDLTYLVNNGTSLTSPYAQAITTDGATPLSGVIQVSASRSVACAVRVGSTSNEIWCWGLNQSRALGTGDDISRRYPTKIAGVTNPTAVAGTFLYWGGQNAFCAIDGGNVYCWGYNTSGQCGVANSNSPVAAPTLVKMPDGTTPFASATKLYAGSNRICALRSGATLWCWGAGYQNYAGNVGFTNVVEAGSVEIAKYLTSDGMYHYSTVTVSPKCGSLQ